jgi:hypothetical protein
MKKEKLSLNDLKVQSFVTSAGEQEAATIKGGALIEDLVTLVNDRFQNAVLSQQICTYAREGCDTMGICEVTGAMPTWLY